jgi:hypothetical protein
MRIPTFLCQRFELLDKGLHYFYDFENWNMDILGRGDLGDKRIGSILEYGTDFW